jgi:mycothiol synthase
LERVAQCVEINTAPGGIRVANACSIPIIVAMTVSAFHVPGFTDLTARPIDAPTDYAALVALHNQCWPADGRSSIDTIDDTRRIIETAQNYEPANILLIEQPQRLIAEAAFWWRDDELAGRLFEIDCCVLPAFRNMGIGRALMDWHAQRAAAICAAHPTTAKQTFSTFAYDVNVGKLAMLNTLGYAPSWRGGILERAMDTVLPEAAQPEGVLLRPLRAEDLPDILALWRASHAAEGAPQVKPTDAEVRVFAGENPAEHWPLWRVARDVITQTLIGFVGVTADHEPIVRTGKRHGDITMLAVHRDWRGRGIGKILLLSGMRAIQAQGCEIASLGVDFQNPAALRLYESVGFVRTVGFAEYQKLRG